MVGGSLGEVLFGEDVEVTSVEELNVEQRTHGPEQDKDHNAIGEDEGTPRVGMVFKTLEEVRGFYNQYAWRAGFGTATRRSYYNPEDGECNRVTLTCCKEGRRVYKTLENSRSYGLRLSARTDCQAKIKVQKYVDGLFHLVEVNLEHNHELNPSAVGFFRSHKRWAKKLPVKPESTTGQEAHPLFLIEDDVEALNEFFLRMQTANTNFFHLMDMDKDGRLSCVFWADGRCKAAYQRYGDVVTFDTTYLTSNYETPLVSFTGVNNHGQLVLFGCGLLSTRSTEAYKWLFMVWLSCMSGTPPNSIITDHCKVIKEAVTEMFPEARHRLCLWHVMKKTRESLGELAEYKAIKGIMEKAVYESLRADEFEEEWRNMIENYGLNDNKWLSLLYEKRHAWVPVFVKEAFWAGMSCLQHQKTVDSFFDGFICPKTSVRQFISKYESALQSKYEKEVQLDIDSLHKSPQLITKFYMEDQLRQIYTVDMFKKFQEEIRSILYCIPSPARVDGLIAIFEVKEPASMEDINQMENKNYEVTYNSSEQEVRCVCCLFQSHGILCRHALSVLNFLGVYEIPPQYILERWRKDFKHRHVLTCSTNDVVANGPMERYKNLYKCCLKFAELGAIADENYEYAMKMINEVTEELIENGCLNNNMQTKTSSTAGSTKNGKRNMRHENDEFYNLEHGRQNGQLIKTRKETIVEEMAKASQKVSQRKPVINSQNNVLRIAPHTPQFDTHIWTQEQESINLTEEVTPTNLSISSYFGIQLNHQHAIDSQSGRRWSFQQMLQQAPTPVAPPGPWAT